MPTGLAAQSELATAPNTRIIGALQKLQTLDQQLQEVGHRLTTANAVYCEPKSQGIGVLFHDINQYGDKIAAKAAFGFPTALSVSAVVPGSPTHKAGLRTGDSLIAIDGTLVEDSPIRSEIAMEEKPAYQRLANIRALKKETMADGEIELRVERDGVRQDLEIQTIAKCASQFQITVDDDRNASADGEIVTISSALAEYVQSDDELAAIAAHELSHNLLKHRERLNAAKVNRGFFGQFGKSAGRVKQAEIEADRLSIWLMVNAGYDPQAAIRFWTRYGKRYGKGIFSASTHYRWKKRVKLFEEEITKIAATEHANGMRQPPLLLE